ncbi:DNA circularization protein [Hafnia alvei]|uniref:DNA circulation protein n=1 Tax=Hafnia alvei ATCC 51873 TaxID=1002364 RepID=G9Y0H2_HAFAL|nr:DNA circularization N-terminal domain-containing protein [Hafnia alvei]EHM48851.1 DNA circulation protein [Hafnia alvei ATCC 51873]QQE44201.1 DNA circularization N-terminal domain-containing protein [Hafnia alvei]
MADTINDIAAALGVDLLMPASFRGVQFDCLFTRDTLAKDTVTYAYPYRDGEEVEDQGLKAVNFRLQAIFWGNRYQTQLKTFLNALKTAGTGELVHPVYGSVPDVQFLEAGVFHEVEPINAVTVDLVFVESGQPDALFATPHYEADGDSVFDSAISWFGDAMDTLRDIQQDISRVTNIIASAEYVVNALANEVQSTIGSALNYLDYPTAFISDLKHLTGAFTDRLSLSEASRLSDWNALTGLKDTMLTLPLLRTTRQQTMSPGSVFASTLRRASVMPQSDTEMINQAVRLVAVSEMIDTASDIFVNETASPTLSATDIERITGDVRALIVGAIAAQRSSVSVRMASAELAQTGIPDTRRDQAIIAALQESAWHLQEQARGLILALPPLVQRQVTRRCNLPLLAFEWYGDASRATQLARLNPSLRESNNLNPGDVLYAWAK